MMNSLSWYLDTIGVFIIGGLGVFCHNPAGDGEAFVVSGELIDSAISVVAWNSKDGQKT